MRAAPIAIVLVACGHPPPAPATGSGSATLVPIDAAIDAPPTLDRDLPRLAIQALALYEEVATAFTTAGEDCAAATAKLDDIAARHADVIAANDAVIKDHRAKDLRAALAVHQDRFDAAAKTIMTSTTMTKCSSDKAFEHAFDRLMAP